MIGIAVSMLVAPYVVTMATELPTLVSHCHWAKHVTHFTYTMSQCYVLAKFCMHVTITPLPLTIKTKLKL